MLRNTNKQLIWIIMATILIIITTLKGEVEQNEEPLTSRVAIFSGLSE